MWALRKRPGNLTTGSAPPTRRRPPTASPSTWAIRLASGFRLALAAEQAQERRTGLLAELGLEPKAAKTRIVHLEVDGGGFDFLGFHRPAGSR
jgi:hypothetical protein